jgi:hypothetical protein
MTKKLDGLETEGDAIAYHDRHDAEQLAEWRRDDAIAYHGTVISMTEIDIYKKNIATLLNSYIFKSEEGKNNVPSMLFPPISHYS